MSRAFGNDVTVAPKLARLRIVCRYRGDALRPECLGVLQDGAPDVQEPPTILAWCEPCWRRDVRAAQACNGLIEKAVS